jgi:hypothetical protein
MLNSPLAPFVWWAWQEHPFFMTRVIVTVCASGRPEQHVNSDRSDGSVANQPDGPDAGRGVARGLADGKIGQHRHHD